MKDKDKKDKAKAMPVSEVNADKKRMENDKRMGIHYDRMVEQIKKSYGGSK